MPQTISNVNDDFQVLNQLTNYLDLMRTLKCKFKSKEYLNVYKKYLHSSLCILNKTLTIHFSSPSTLNPILFIPPPPSPHSTLFINPIKTGGSESLYSLGGGGLAPTPTRRKRTQRIGIGMKCMFIAQFFMASSLKKQFDR